MTLGEFGIFIIFVQGVSFKFSKAISDLMCFMVQSSNSIWFCPSVCCVIISTNRAEGRGALQYIPSNGDPFTVLLSHVVGS